MKRILLFVSLTILFFGLTAFIISSAGIAGKTGSPGEGTCGDCHGGGSGVTQVAISASPAFIANQYIPGQTYTITVTVTNNAYTVFGFDSEILAPTNTNAGIMTSTLTGVKFVNSGVKKNAVQSVPKTGSGSAAFSYVWVAPASGTTTIYATGNAVDGTGGTGGDAPSASTNMVLTPDSGAGIEILQSGISGLNTYPNPVKSEFKLSYNLIEQSNVKVGLYGLNGQTIMEILNENQPSGAHVSDVVLPEGLAKGAYFLTISVNEKQAAKRLIITY